MWARTKPNKSLYCLKYTVQSTAVQSAVAPYTGRVQARQVMLIASTPHPQPDNSPQVGLQSYSFAIGKEKPQEGQMER